MTTLFEVAEVKPLLRWAGSKYNQPAVYTHLQRFWQQMPAGSTYVSLFGGGLGDLLRVMPRYAVIGDTNRALIDFYQFARGVTKPDWTGLDAPYLEVRAQFNTALKARHLDHAEWHQFCADFYRLNQTCFNGVWRVNARGQFNVPEGRNSRGVSLTCQQPDFSAFRQAARRWDFFESPWQSTLFEAAAVPSAFIYADPPYDSAFTAYTKDGFDWQQQVELAESLAKASALHPVAASNLATDRIVELYEKLGFTVEIVSCRRSVSCDGNRVKASEMLAHQGFDSKNYDIRPGKTGATETVL